MVGILHQSIGRKGACSHHGGVTSNIFFVLIISFVTSAWFYFFTTKSKYRAYDDLVVLNKLPLHPLESELKNLKKFHLYSLPTSEAKSKKSFTCFCCNVNYKIGTAYKYYFKDSKRIKYCKNCADNLPEVNSEIVRCEKEHNDLRFSQKEQVYNYYLGNAKAKLSQPRRGLK